MSARQPRRSPAAPPRIRNDALALMGELDRKVHWLSAWMIHHANHVRESRDGLKVGGHQASSASMATILSALYFGVLTPRDRVAVKPHASPAFHAIQYLYGRQSRDQLERFRGFGGAQSYPSRTKDKPPVDFSTGSVGLGVAVTAFASIVQDYLIAHGRLAGEAAGRMVALLGDAELDEGNIYEALIEGAKHGLRNTWWIVDYNRQSLDATTSDRMFTRFDEMFRACSWDVVTLKYGRALERALAEPGGAGLSGWIDACPNDLYAALSFQGGAAWRAQLECDLAGDRAALALVASRSDEELARLMTDLAGHDLERLVEAFEAVGDDRPKLFIVYTIKGVGLPFQGHKDNHSGLMTPPQMAELRRRMGVAEGQEWERFAGLPRDPEDYEAFLRTTAFATAGAAASAGPVEVPPRPAFPRPTGRQSTQVAFGKIMNELARTGGPLADALVTASPDVTVSTNLGGWVNQRGLFSRSRRADRFKESNIASPQRWIMGPLGQHIELGIAENNLFLLLAAAGLSADLFASRVIPVGTLYDPFINRGLDALNYACYQDARFMLVATPSGLTLGPEGGAHQSIHTPLIGMAQDKLAYFEPAYADELSAVMQWAFQHLQRPDGGSVYLRLSTRPLDQPERVLGDAQVEEIIGGAYWEIEPGPEAELAVVYTGAVAPEAHQALAAMRDELPGCGLLAVPSPDRLQRGWTGSLAARASGDAGCSLAERLLARLSPAARLVTVIDGPPGTLAWIGAVQGHRTAPLGLDRFGQSGDLTDLYRAYRLDADAILDAAASALLPGRP
jgi:pyruvate dehydrogenase E1 component